VHYLGIDYLIVYAFLLITLVIGLLTGRGIRDIREYANANKMFGTGALVLTWLATDIAGETILDMTGAVRTVGIIQPLTVFGGVSIAILLQALVFAPKFTQFNDCITMGDVMGTLYKGASQIMTGVLGFFTALCIAGMELTVIGILSEHLGIDFRFGVWIGGLLLVLYTTHGGIKSVAFTDLFQGLVLFAVLPMITVAALKQAGGIKQVLLQVPTAQLQLLGHPKASYYTALFLSLSVFQFSVIDPALMQRILMGPTKQQLRNQFFIVAVCLLALMVAVSLLGLSSIVLFPDANTDVPIVLRTIGHVLPIGLKGLAMAGLVAITMATFDSFLHAAGLTLIHDVVHPVCKRMGNTIDELKWVRYATMGIGLVVIGIGSMRADNLYNFVLLSYKFTGPLLAFPLFAGALGLKPDQRAFYAASGATIAVILLTAWWVPVAQEHWVPLVGVVTNGIVFLGVHAIRNNGFTVVNLTNSKEYLWRPRRASIFTQLRRLLPTPQRLVRYSQKQVEKYGAPYALFGIFCCVNYLFPYFMWEHDAPTSYNLMLYLRTIGAMVCGLLLVRDQWPKFLLPYLPTCWHLTLLYCLPFTSTVMFLLTQGSIEWLINVALTIMFLIVLVDWISFMILAALGVALGCLFHTLAIGPIALHLDFSTGYLLVYTCLFSTLVALLFARRKEQHLAAKLRAIEEQHHAEWQVGAHPHPAIQRIATAIDRQAQEFLAVYNRESSCGTAAAYEEESHTVPDFLHYFFSTALEVLKQGTHINKQLTEVMTATYLAPRLALRSLKASLIAILSAYTARYDHEIEADLAEDYLIHASLQHLEYALVHVLQFLRAHDPETKVHLWIERQEGIHIRLSGKAVSASLVQELFLLFPLKSTSRNMSLAISRLFIEAHGGHVLCKTCSIPGRAYTEFVLVIPPAEIGAEVSAELTQS
jgi:Na+/proline symporter